MNSLSKETQLTILYILIAFTFSVAMRMIWIYQFQDAEAFKWNGQFMINTNDGYFWAEGARDILSGVGTNPSGENFFDKLHQPNDLSPVAVAASQLTALFAYVLPFSFESVILYMPVFLGSLVVIPIILIAKGLDNLDVGLIAALLASIAWSYYNRTMVGYHDTDMLNIVFPMFLLWSILSALKTNDDQYLISTALVTLVYQWWYLQSYALEFSFFGLVLFYTLVFDRKNTYNYKLLTIMMFAMIDTHTFVRLILLVGSFYLFKKENLQKYIYYILGIAVLLFFITGGLDPIWNRLKIYIFERNAVFADDGMKLHFFAVMQTVREAGKISFETFANRISGHTVTFIFSIIGYLYLVYRHKIMLLALPMVGLGFLASIGGLRFTIYAVPILALGVAFLITELVQYITDKKSVKYFAYITFTFLILFPNYKHIDEYKVPTVMNSSEVATLDRLKTIASREDYVLAWWDYGYPIRYYADVKTLADGAKHEGYDNYPLSYILTNRQEEAAKMARLDVEYTEKSFNIQKNNLNKSVDKQVELFRNIEEMTKKYGFDDTNDFLLSLKMDINLPKKTRDIYFYLPYKMLNIYPTVSMFSNMNLMTGEKYKAPDFFLSRNFKETQSDIQLSENISLNKADLSLNINGKKVTIKRLVTTKYIGNQEFKKEIKYIDYTSGLSVIYMSAYNTFILLDEKTYNSLYIQLFVLEEYDKTLFEKVVVNPHAKIYKLKI